MFSFLRVRCSIWQCIRGKGEEILMRKSKIEEKQLLHQTNLAPTPKLEAKCCARFPRKFPLFLPKEIYSGVFKWKSCSKIPAIHSFCAKRVENRRRGIHTILSFPNFCHIFWNLFCATKIATFIEIKIHLFFARSFSHIYWKYHLFYARHVQNRRGKHMNQI